MEHRSCSQVFLEFCTSLAEVRCGFFLPLNFRCDLRPTDVRLITSCAPLSVHRVKPATVGVIYVDLPHPEVLYSGTIFGDIASLVGAWTAS